MYLRVINKIFLALGYFLGYRLTYHARSIFQEDYNYCKLVKSNSEIGKVAIIVQGPIHFKPEVTINTLILYRRIFPEAHVILSTWSDIDDALCAKLGSYNVEVLVNERPKESGRHNVNLQLVSTKNAIEVALNKGYEYVLKTRTDMRFTRYTSLSGLIGFLESYASNSSSRSKGRIIEIGSTACRFRPWSLCDVFQFGYTIDMHHFWSAQLDNRTGSSHEFFATPKTPREVSEYNVAEIYLHRNYAEFLGYNTGVTPEDYYSFIKSEILIIDKEMIDLAWFKYEAKEFSWVGDPCYGQNQVLSRIHFFEWLSIYLGQEVDIKTAEEYLDVQER